MGVFARGKKLWLRFRDVEGKWQSVTSGYEVGQEALAEETLAIVEAKIASEVAARPSPPLAIRSIRVAWNNGYAEALTPFPVIEGVDGYRGRGVEVYVVRTYEDTTPPVTETEWAYEGPF